MSKNPTPNRVQRVRLEAVVARSSSRPDAGASSHRGPESVALSRASSQECHLRDQRGLYHQDQRNFAHNPDQRALQVNVLNQDQRSMQVNVGVDPELVVAREAEIMSQAHAAVNAATSELESETSAFRDQVVYLFSMKPNRIHKVLNSAMVKWFPRCKLNMPRNLNMLSMWQLKLMERLADS